MENFLLQSKLTDLISPLVGIKYKHVSSCNAVASLVTIAAALVWIHPPYLKIEFCSNQLATQITVQKETLDCELNSSLFSWRVLRRWIFFLTTPLREFRRGWHAITKICHFFFLLLLDSLILNLILNFPVFRIC